MVNVSKRERDNSDRGQPGPWTTSRKIDTRTVDSSAPIIDISARGQFGPLNRSARIHWHRGQLGSLDKSKNKIKQSLSTCFIFIPPSHSRIFLTSPYGSKTRSQSQAFVNQKMLFKPIVFRFGVYFTSNYSFDKNLVREISNYQPLQIKPHIFSIVFSECTCFLFPAFQCLGPFSKTLQKAWNYVSKYKNGRCPRSE
jgi:hypothetical protein